MIRTRQPDSDNSHGTRGLTAYLQVRQRLLKFPHPGVGNSGAAQKQLLEAGHPRNVSARHHPPRCGEGQPDKALNPLSCASPGPLLGSRRGSGSRDRSVPSDGPALVGDRIVVEARRRRPVKPSKWTRPASPTFVRGKSATSCSSALSGGPGPRRRSANGRGSDSELAETADEDQVPIRSPRSRSIRARCPK